MGFLKGKFVLSLLAAVALCACGDDSSNAPEMGDATVGDASTVETPVVDSLPNMNPDSLSGAEIPNLSSAALGELSSASEPQLSSGEQPLSFAEMSSGEVPPSSSSSRMEPPHSSDSMHPHSSDSHPPRSSASETSLDFSFYTGADISTVQEYERWGTKFYDVDGTEKDVFTLLKDHGFNAIRLKTFVSPKAQYGYAAAGCDHDAEAYADKDHIVAYAQKIKAAGMAFLLDIHYSDNWADPAKQIIPSRWRSVTSSDAMADSVYNYTYDLLSALKQVGATPTMVQIGNETTPGILMHVPNSSTNCWGDGVDKAPASVGGDMSTSAGKANAAKYFKAGIRAVKAVSQEIKTVLHIESIRKPNTINWWMTEIFKNQKVPADVMGFSAYTAYGDDKPDSWKNLFETLSSSYPDLEFIVAEYNGGDSKDTYKFDGSRKRTNEMVRGLDRWIGTFFWEPTLSGAWGAPLFDWDGPDLRANKDAFEEYKVSF
ncbi:MAG: glycosyl hydrolase 53 family protein [Fibrobacter sp.]|nr:glycosyl hydrolase 53 family protein [Fibrobacter sp.]